MQLGSLSDGVGGGLSVPAARLWVSEPRTACPCQTGLQPGGRRCSRGRGGGGGAPRGLPPPVCFQGGRFPSGLSVS